MPTQWEIKQLTNNLGGEVEGFPVGQGYQHPSVPDRAFLSQAFTHHRMIVYDSI